MVAITGLAALNLELAGTAADEAAPAVTETALNFDRDPIQLVTTPVEVWGLAFSANDEFLAAQRRRRWSEPGQRPGRHASGTLPRPRKLPPIPRRAAA